MPPFDLRCPLREGSEAFRDLERREAFCCLSILVRYFVLGSK